MEQDIRNAQSDEHDMPDVDQDEQDYRDKQLFDDGVFVSNSEHAPSQMIYMVKAIQDFQTAHNRNPFAFGKGKDQFILKHIDKHDSEHGSDIFELGALYQNRVDSIFTRKVNSIKQTNQTPEYGC